MDQSSTRAPFIGEIEALRKEIARLQERARKTEQEGELLRILLENTTDYVYFKDRDRRFVRASNAFCDLFGCDLKDIIGRTDEELFPPEIAEGTVRDDGLIIETGTSITNKEEGGEAIGEASPWVLTSKQPWLDRDGRIIGLFGISRDITERKRAEKKRLESESNYRDLVETSQDLIWKCDHEGRFTYLNSAWEETLGYSPAEMLGHRFHEFKPSEHAEKDQRTFESVLRGQKFLDYETTYLTKAGEILNLVFTARLQRDPDGVVIGTQGTARDITDGKRAEAARRKLEAQVRRAQTLESLGVLAGGIAHDFNNLLTGILASADLALLRMSSESPDRDHIEVIRKSAMRAADLTQQILTFAGKGHSRTEPLRLDEMVMDSRHLIDSSISKKATFEVAFEPELPSVDADPTQVRQVIMNLIINASEALRGEKGTINLSTGIAALKESGDASEFQPNGLSRGRYVYFKVTDTGCGMDEETRSRLFDPFFTTKFQGRGMGMSAVLGTVRAHKGAIRVSSEPGLGTTICVLLPAMDSSAPRNVDLDDDVSWRGRGTVLVVDDEENVRITTGAILRELGLDVLTAANGRAGIEVFRSRSADIDVVLLDLTMPDMDGEEAFAEIHKIKPYARVFLCSGYAEADVKQRFENKAVSGVIPKPFTVCALVRKLRAVLEP